MDKLFKLIFLLILLNLLAVLATEDPIVTLSLSKENFVQNEKLSGSLILNFTDSAPDKDLSLRFGQNSKIIKLSEVLARLNKIYIKMPGEKTLEPLEQPQDSIFFPPLRQELGVAAPIEATGFSASGNVGGVAIDGVFPKFPYLDIGLDGLYEWSYLGEQTDWSDFTSPANINSQDQDFEVTFAETALCEKFNINKKVKSVNVKAKYQKESSDVKITARFLSVPDNQKRSFGRASCELTKENPQDEWGSCEIKFDLPSRVREGHFLICLKAEQILAADTSTSTTSSTLPQNSALFTLATDTSLTTQNAYNCRYSGEAGSFTCNKYSTDFLIQAALPVYDGILDTLVPFEEGQTEFDLSENMVKYKTQNCNQQDLRCIIPIEIGSETKGRIYFSAFSLNMEIEGGRQRANLQKLLATPDIITKIESRILNQGPYKLEIPLSFFDFKVPEVQEYDVIPLEIRFGSKRIIEPIEIYSSALSDQQDINTTIANIINLLDDYSDSKALLLKFDMNIDSLKTTFNSYNLQLEDIESNTTKTQQEKDEEKSALLTQVAASKENIPRFIYKGDKAQNIPAIPPTTIPNSIIDSPNIKEYILSLQDSISISSNAEEVYVKTFGSQTYDYTIITRTVTNAPSDAYITEIIPKTIVSSASDLKLDSSTTVIEQDPIIKKTLTSGSGTLSYMVKGSIIGQITDINTLVVSLRDAPTGDSRPASYANVQCGNNFCDVPLENENNCPEDCKPKRNWLIIIILLLIFAAGIFYINFYRGPGSLFAKEQELFHSKTDKINLINYIKKSSRHKSQTQVINTLLSKGWSREQINFAFKEIQRK